MKRLFASMVIAGLAVTGTEAQTLNVVSGNVTYAFQATQTGDMTYQNGETLTIQGKTFQINDITQIYVDDSDVKDNTVSVYYNGNEAMVTVAGNVAQYVTPTIGNAHVNMVQSDDVSDSTCGEITYSLSGTSTDGAFVMVGAYKATVELNGLTLTNQSGAPLNLQDGKRIEVSVKKDTENTLADASGGDWKGCLVCKGHLELKGKGLLNVYGNTAHGIYAKEYVEMKNCTVNVLSAVNDGINCNQYFLMESGALSISGVSDDGVQVSYKNDTDREEEDTGALTIKGGTLNISVTGTCTKGLKADGDMTFSDGTITITSTGGGAWDEDDSKAKASSCIASDSNIVIDGGTLSLTSTGNGGKGINADGTLTVNGGEITVSTTGGMYTYGNSWGNSGNQSSNKKCSPKGVKVDGNVDINGGTINVSTTGDGGEGIESKAVLTINGGTITINAYDDAINSGSHMYINDGTVTVSASNNDGLDSNGNMYFNGGYVMAFGTTSPECGIDANEEGGYTVYFKGGTLLAVGGGNSVPSSSESTQPYVNGTMAVAANSEITLKSGTTTLATFTVPSTYKSSSSGGGFGPNGGGGFGGRGGGHGGNSGSSSSILVTCAGLVSGSSYTLSNGSSSSTVTAVLKGNSRR